MDDPKQVVRRYYDEIFRDRNLNALDELIAPEFVGHAVGFGDFTVDDMRRDITREHTDMPDDETIIEDQLVCGDRVVTRWRYQWKHDHSLMGEHPTGDWLQMEGVHIDWVRNGKIIERWELKDLWGVIQRLNGTVSFGGNREAASP